MKFFDILLTTLIVLAIVLGLQTVGVVLMSAMIVAPAAAARQWTDHLGTMVFLSSLFGALAGIVGAVLSSSIPRLPTGPTIVLCISVIVLVSLFLAPRRGLMWNWFREKKNRGRLQVETILEGLYSLASSHENPEHPHSIAVLRLMSSEKAGVEKSLKILEEQGLVRSLNSDEWALTKAGIQEAQSRINIRQGSNI